MYIDRQSSSYQRWLPVLLLIKLIQLLKLHPICLEHHESGDTANTYIFLHRFTKVWAGLDESDLLYLPLNTSRESDWMIHYVTFPSYKKILFCSVSCVPSLQLSNYDSNILHYMD